METQRPARISASTVATIGLIGLVIGFLLGCITYKRFDPCVELPVVAITRDTLVVRDTLRLEIPAPTAEGSTEVRRDTVWLEIKPVVPLDALPGVLDTIRINDSSAAPRIEPDGALTIPIEQKEYQTENYKAVVEGWRPRLVSMEVYPETRTYTETITKLEKPRYALTAGAGVGYDGQKVLPHIGLTFGFAIWSGNLKRN